MFKVDIDKLVSEAIEDRYIEEVVNEATTIGIASHIRKEEMRVQFELLKFLSGGDSHIVDQLIANYATIFRKAIKAYRKHNIVPDKDEIIKFTNKEIGGNLIEIAKRMGD